VVTLRLSQAAFRYLVDGQGRLMGIRQALKTNPALADNTIDIKFVRSEGLVKDTQLFADINMTPVKPNKSQCAAIDSRLVINRFAKLVIHAVHRLTDRIDFTKASVTNSQVSQKLWTLNQVVAFVQLVTGATPKSFQTLLGSEEREAYWTGKYMVD
jgi:DGQHR domain-containing protein